MNFSNKLTLSRIALTFVLMFFLFKEGPWTKIAAMAVFLIACLTDFLDGYLARARNEISDFGKIMDPIADKVLVLGAFLSFVELQLIPAWILVIIIIRELMVTGLRLFAVRKGMVLAAQSAGKHKTVSQLVTIFFILSFIVIRDSAVSFSFWNDDWQYGFRVAIFFCMMLTVAFTLYSGFFYVWQNRRLIRSL